MESPSFIPSCPPIMSINAIQKITNIAKLKELERKYDDFLEKNIQILLLYNTIEEYLEIRDALTIRISKLKREHYLLFLTNKQLFEE